MRKNGLAAALFKHTAGVQHADALHMARHQRQVVADEDHGHALLSHQFLQQVQHLRLYGAVQRRGGLVGNQHLGLAGQRAGQHDALALAARKLVRVVTPTFACMLDADALQPADGLFPRRLRRKPAVQAQGFCHCITHTLQRVKGGHGLLKNHADTGTSNTAPCRFAHAQQFLSVEPDAAVRRRIARQQTHHGQHGQGFAAARLANQPQRLTALQGEVELLYGLGHPAGGADLYREVFDLQQGGSCVRHRNRTSILGSSTSRRPSPRKLRPSTASAMHTPG